MIRELLYPPTGCFTGNHLSLDNGTLRSVANVWGIAVLITPLSLEHLWGVHPNMVLHVGAHRGEELESYENLGWGAGGVFWIEAQSDVAEELRLRLEDLGLSRRHRVIQARVWSVDDERMNFKITNNGESSSLLDMGSHSSSYPEVRVTHEVEMTTISLDTLFTPEDQFDLVVLDIQGTELQALQGFSKHLEKVSWILAEINTGSLYRGCASWSEVDAYLANYGFVCVDWEMTAADWGDALWIRRDLLPSLIKLRRLIRKLKKRLWR